MKFNLADIDETKRAYDFVDMLKTSGKVVEIKMVRKTRSLNQNSYLHLLLSAFGAHFGYSLEEAKLIYKQMSPQVYIYNKKGRDFMRSSAELDTAEMTKTIDVLRDKSAEAGYPLPDASDEAWLRQLQNTVEQNERFL